MEKKKTNGKDPVLSFIEKEKKKNWGRGWGLKTLEPK